MPPGVTAEAAVFAAAAAIDGRPVVPACDPSLVVERAIVHRVSALLLRSTWARGLHPAVRQALEEDARLSAVHSAILDRELEVLLARLADQGIRPLVTKGAHLAHTVYAEPALRPRADTDLLITPEQKPGISAVLTACGYTRSARTSGSTILGQFQLERRLRTGITHYVDVHWRPAAPLLFDRALDIRAMIATAKPIPELGPHARGPSYADALALSCIHLVSHHWHQILLVWLRDIRLLADALMEDDRQRAVECAVAGSYTVVLHRALMTARLYFESDGLDRAITCVASHVNDAEPAAALVRDGRRPVDDLWLDLRDATWHQRATLLREHVLPPVDYMRDRFEGPTPLAYAKRLFGGVKKWFTVSR